MTESTLSFFARLSLAIGAFFRLLGDGKYAAKVAHLDAASQSALPKAQPESLPRAAAVAAPEHLPRDLGPGLQLLNLLQREGRLVDFLRQDIVGFSDADVGAAARVVHQGCCRAIEQAVTLESIRSEPEGTSVTLDAHFDPKLYRLVGNVQGEPPYHGTLRHRGWRVTELRLEEPLANANLTVVAPAEVEL